MIKRDHSAQMFDQPLVSVPSHDHFDVYVDFPKDPPLMSLRRQSLALWRDKVRTGDREAVVSAWLQEANKARRYAVLPSLLAHKHRDDTKYFDTKRARDILAKQQIAEEFRTCELGQITALSPKFDAVVQLLKQFDKQESWYRGQDGDSPGKEKVLVFSNNPFVVATFYWVGIFQDRHEA